MVTTATYLGLDAVKSREHKSKEKLSKMNLDTCCSLVKSYRRALKCCPI